MRRDSTMIAPSPASVRHSTQSPVTSRLEHARAKRGGREPTAVRTLTSAQTWVTLTTAVGLMKGAGTRMAALTVSVRRAICTTKMACVLVSITDTGCSATLMTQLTCVGKCVCVFLLLLFCCCRCLGGGVLLRLFSPPFFWGWGGREEGSSFFFVLHVPALLSTLWPFVA